MILIIIKVTVYNEEKIPLCNVAQRGKANFVKIFNHKQWQKRSRNTKKCRMFMVTIIIKGATIKFIKKRRGWKVSLNKFNT